MSPFLYALVCAVGSLLVIALADYTYKTASLKWGKNMSPARQQEQREHREIAQHLIDVTPKMTSNKDDEPKSVSADLEAYAKSLLNDSKTSQ